jgi:hypothetical protein
MFTVLKAGRCYVARPAPDAKGFEQPAKARGRAVIRKARSTTKYAANGMRVME